MQVSLFDRSHLGKKHIFTHKGLTGSYYLVGDPQGETLIFLHGLTGNHIGMLPMSAHMYRYNCILPDLPGHGLTPVPSKDTDLQDLADWLVAFVKQWPNPIVLTHSYGGSLAMLALSSIPDYVRGCILLNPVIDTSHFARGYRQFAMILRPTISAILNDIGVLRHRRHLYLLERSTPDVIKIMKQLNDAEGILKTSREQMAYFQKLGMHFDDPAIFRNAPRSLTNKTYCIVASRDTLVSPKNNAFLQEIFGRGHVKVCRVSGHLMPIEAIDDTAKLVNKVLKRIIKPAPFFKLRLARRPKA